MSWRHKIQCIRKVIKWTLHFRHVLFYFILMFPMAISNQRCLGIFIIVSFVIFIIMIFIRKWFINYPQYQIIILMGVLDEVDDIISELPGDEGFLLHGRLAWNIFLGSSLVWLSQSSKQWFLTETVIFGTTSFLIFKWFRNTVITYSVCNYGLRDV